MKNTRLAAILLVVFVDLLGFSLILPQLPYYADKYGVSDTVAGLLIERLGPGGPGLFGALILVGLSVFVWKNIFNHPIAADMAAQARGVA
jgi:hypothetical protein